jgi:hypothetical protein
MVEKRGTRVPDLLRDFAVPLAEGLKTTFKHLFRETFTVEYPEEVKPVSPRFRGRHMLRRYHEGPYKGLSGRLHLRGGGGEYRG